MTSYTWNFQNFTCVFTILVKFDIYFLGLPWEIVFVVITAIANYIYSPWKMQKKIAILFKFFWYKVFVHWKLKLLNFLMDIIVLTCGYHYYVISLGIFRARRSVLGWVKWQPKVLSTRLEASSVEA